MQNLGAPRARSGKTASALILGAFALACGDEARIVSAPGAAPDEPLASPAVMVSLLVPSPEVSNFYVGVYPELPGELDLSQMLEVRAGYDAKAFNGHIYVWEGETGTYTRYEVDDDLQLSEGPSVRFLERGGSGVVMTQFVSPNLAYSLTRDELELIVWDPTEMVVITSISAANLRDPEYPDLDYGEPALFGDHVAWPIQWSRDGSSFKPEVGVVLASTTSNEPPLVLRDGRCGAGWMLFVDDAGDLYATGNASFGYAHFFGDAAGSFPNDCVVRIRSGALEFDAGYVRDLNQATGSPAIYHPWHLEDHSLLAAVWDPADDPAAIEPDEYWNTPMLRTLVRIEDGESTPIAGVPKSGVWSTLTHRIDDTLYMLSMEMSPFVGGRSELYRVNGASAEPALSTDGFLWSIGRVR